MEISGSQLLAKILKLHKVKVIFGVVGIPVTSVAEYAIQEEIRFIAMRNEQSASYAASAYGYLTGEPGVCLSVGGPGMIHSLAGIANSWSNCWPLICISGTTDIELENFGGFQSCPQLQIAGSLCKAARRATSLSSLKQLFEAAWTIAATGRPGSVYLEIPGNLLRQTIQMDLPKELQVAAPCRSVASAAQFHLIAQKLQNSKKPLVIIGKGAAYCRAESAIRQFISEWNIPFLPTPMGKGVVSDLNENCASAARSYVLLNADLIFLFGARLNWMLHFGLPPRFHPKVSFVHFDIFAEEIDLTRSIPVVGDMESNVAALCSFLMKSSICLSLENWKRSIKAQVNKNEMALGLLEQQENESMTYYTAYHVIRHFVDENTFISLEGANTMDIGRTLLHSLEPRCRLDAGTFGTISFVQYY